MGNVLEFLVPRSHEAGSPLKSRRAEAGKKKRRFFAALSFGLFLNREHETSRRKAIF